MSIIRGALTAAALARTLIAHPVVRAGIAAAPLLLTPKVKAAAKDAKQLYRVRVVADPRSNRLLLKGDASGRERLRQLIATLDMPSERLGGVRVFRLKHASAKEVADVLRGLVTGEGGRSASSSSGTSGAAGASSAPVAINANGVGIIADDSLNALVVKADPAVMQADPETRGRAFDALTNAAAGIERFLASLPVARQVFAKRINAVKVAEGGKPTVTIAGNTLLVSFVPGEGHEGHASSLAIQQELGRLFAVTNKDVATK